MATKSTGSVQNDSAAAAPVAPAPVASGDALKAFASGVRWSDVLAAADALTDTVAECAAAGSASKVAAKVARLRPAGVFTFRVTLAAYVLAKVKDGGVNTAQKAELESKLSALRESGRMTDRTLQFGGLALPPLLGEF